MKKLIIFCLTALVMLFFTSCPSPIVDDNIDGDANAPVFTIVYNNSGSDSGTVPVDSGLYKEGDSITIMDEGTLVKAHYGFSSWNTNADGSGSDYQPGDTLAMGTADINLYSQWEYVPYEPSNLFTTSPGRGDDNVYLDRDIHIAVWPDNVFDLASVEASFSISPAVNNTKHLRWFLEAADTELTIELDDLAPDTEYTITFSTALELGGNAIDEEWSWIFTTGTEREFAVPVLTGRPEFLMTNHVPLELTYDISWTSVTGAAEYILQEGRGESFEGWDNEYTVNGLTKTVTVPRSNEYYYRVRGSDGAGNYSEWSRIYFMNPQDTVIAVPTTLMYAGGYIPSIYEYNGTAGGNDEPVSGFDHEVNAAFYYSGSFYYVNENYPDAAVFRMNSSSVDTEITGFDYIDGDSSIYNVNSEWYYSTHEDTPGLGLYQMVPGDSNDIEVTGFDHEFGNNTNGPYFYHDGTDWIYTVNSNSANVNGVFRRQGTEANTTGSNDVELTGFDEGGSLILAPQTTGGIFYGAGGGHIQWYEYSAATENDDTMITGFDVVPGGRQILTDGTDIFYPHNGSLFKKVDGALDDTVLADYDPHTGNPESVFTYGSTIYYGGNTVYQVSDTADIEINGFDDTGNNSFTFFDGIDFYYIQYDFNIGARVIYKKVGTEPTGDGSDDILITGFDENIYGPGYSFCLINNEFYYLSFDRIMKVVGTEENFTGSNDEEICNISSSGGVVHFVYYDGHFYYSDEDNNVYLYIDNGTDALIFDGSKIDRDMTSFILLP